MNKFSIPNNLTNKEMTQELNMHLLFNGYTKGIMKSAPQRSLTTYIGKMFSRLKSVYDNKTKFCFDTSIEYPIFLNGSIKYLDIAIERLKLNIEYDGQKWHTNKDKDKDKIRDISLKNVGWTVIRINKNDFKQIGYSQKGKVNNYVLSIEKKREIYIAANFIIYLEVFKKYREKKRIIEERLYDM